MKQYDKFNSPPLSFTDASHLSGAISLSTYVFLFAYLLSYIYESLSGSFPSSSQAVVFPQRNDKTEIYMPAMHCIADSGCWYIPFIAEGASELQGGKQQRFSKQQNEKLHNHVSSCLSLTFSNVVNTTSNDLLCSSGTNPGDKECYWVNKGDTVPSEHRRIFHDSDPVDSFTALWIGVNFGFSYDVEKVTSYGLTLETETVEGPKDLEMTAAQEGKARYLLYKGKR